MDRAREQISIPSFVPYAGISRHGLIGDRRTAALVAGDGTIDWLCLSNYDGDVVFGALVDAQNGGYWRLGPKRLLLGSQSYPDRVPTLRTIWQTDGAVLELTDLMAWPENERPPERESQRILVRRLRCLEGEASCALHLVAACNFSAGDVVAGTSSAKLAVRAGSHQLRLWTSRPLDVSSSNEVHFYFSLRAGEEYWAVLSEGEAQHEWSTARLQSALAETERYWHDWDSQLSYRGPRAAEARFSGMLVHLLSYSPNGSVVAAPTTSLPERIGGDWNADYRFSWVRDASLSVAALTLLGNTNDARRYIAWLCTLTSSVDSPLQVLYDVRGKTRLAQKDRRDLHGYGGSQPVRFGNNAYKQIQHGTLGYLLDCIHIYLLKGGNWEPDFWDLVCRVADYLAKNWCSPDNSIWELSEQHPFLSGQLMSWVGLDRAIKIAQKTGATKQVEHWRLAMEEVRTVILEKNWSKELGSFRQRNDGANLDAVALLVAVMGFLPLDDARVPATVDCIKEHLTIDDFVYRFDPCRTPGIPQPAQPLGDYEGAFLPCTFWMATTHALMGQPQRTDALLQRAEQLARPTGLFAEAVDPRTGTFLGNYPLLFSHAEYVRAVSPLRTQRQADDSLVGG